MRKRETVRRSIINVFGEGIETIKNKLRKKGYLVTKEKDHLEIIVSPKEKEEVEKILEKLGCCKKSPEPQKNFLNFAA